MKALQEQQSLIIFQVGPILCSVDVLDVDAIIMPPELSHMPGQAAFVEGVFRHREQTYSLVNLYRKFGVEDNGNFARSGRVVIAHTHRGPMGFMVDAVLEVTSSTEHEWGEAPHFNNGNIFLKTLHWQEQMVLHTDFDRLYAMEDSEPLRNWAARQGLKVVNSESVQAEQDGHVTEPGAQLTTNQIDTAAVSTDTAESSLDDNPSDAGDTTDALTDTQAEVEDPVASTDTSTEVSRDSSIDTHVDTQFDADTETVLGAGDEASDLTPQSTVSSAVPEVGIDTEAGAATQTATAIEADQVAESEFEHDADFRDADSESDDSESDRSEFDNVIPFASRADKLAVTEQSGQHIEAAERPSADSGIAVAMLDQQQDRSDELAQAVHQVVDETLAKNPDWKVRLGWLGGAITALALVLSAVFSFMGDNTEPDALQDLTGANSGITEAVSERGSDAVSAIDTDTLPAQQASGSESGSESGPEPEPETVEPEAVEPEAVDQTQTETRAEPATEVVSQDDQVVNEFTEKLQQEAPDLVATIKRDSEEVAEPENVEDPATDKAVQSGAQNFEHTVRAGDTLWKLSRDNLGDPYRYPDLAQQNDIENPDLIYPGQRIKYRQDGQD